MATDSTGGTTLAKCALNSLGYPVNGSNAVFIPHIDQTYKLALYTNATDADANTLANAVWVIDDLIQTDHSLREELAATGGLLLIGNVATVAELVTLSPSSGDTVETVSYYASTIPSGSGKYTAATLADIRTAKGDGGWVPDELIDHTAANGLVWMLQHNGEINLYQAGAVGDNTTDDYDSIDAVFQLTNVKAIIPQSTFLINTGLTAPLCESVGGYGINVSTIRAGNGVTKALSIKTSAPSHLHDFQITGNATTNAKGLYVGDATLTAHIAMDRVAVRNFTGTGAVGLYVLDGVAIDYNHCEFTGSTRNIRADAAVVTNGAPTTQVFSGGLCADATEEGAYLTGASQFIFTDQFVFQNNSKHGLLAEIDTGSNVVDLDLNGCYFEGNYGSTTTEYQAKVIGTAAATARVKFRHNFFNGSGSTAKSIHITGSNCRECQLDNNQVPNLTGQILVDGSAQGRSINWPGNLAETVLTITDPTLFYNTATFETEWSAWTPTYASSVGNAATSFTGAGTVTTSLARWKRIGKTLHMVVSFGATLNAVTPTYLSFTLPNGYSAKTAIMYTPASVLDNTTYLGTGVVSTAGTTAIRVYKSLAAPAFTSGSAVECNVIFTIEIV
jgi:hypothetical protein